MKQTIKSLLALLRIRLSGVMVYRASFLTGFFVDASLFIMQLVFFQLLAANGSVGWTRAMYTVFIGSFMTLDGLYMATWFFGIVNLPNRVRSGDLDLVILRPVDTLLYVSFESIDIGSIPIALLGFVVTGVGAAGLPNLSVGNVLLWLLAIALMYVLMYALSLALRSLSFWTKSVNSLGEIENELVNYSFRLPYPGIRGAWRFVLLLFLPYGLAANFPTLALLGETTPLFWLYALALTGAFLALALWIWRKGLLRYESASS